MLCQTHFIDAAYAEEEVMNNQQNIYFYTTKWLNHTMMHKKCLRRGFRNIKWRKQLRKFAEYLARTLIRLVDLADSSELCQVCHVSSELSTWRYKDIMPDKWVDYLAYIVITMAAILAMQVHGTDSRKRSKLVFHHFYLKICHFFKTLWRKWS